MLVKATLINGESQVIAIKGNSWDEVTEFLSNRAVEWYKNIMHISIPVACMSISEQYLNSKQISKIEPLSPEEECKILKTLSCDKNKNILEPVENGVTPLIANKERTVRDCILDMLIEQNGENIKRGFVLYLQNILSGISKYGNTGYADKTELERYTKLSDGLSNINSLSATKLLDYTEKEISNLLGIAGHITLKNFMLINIEKILKESENNGK